MDHEVGLILITVSVVRMCLSQGSYQFFGLGPDNGLLCGNDQWHSKKYEHDFGLLRKRINKVCNTQVERYRHRFYERRSRMRPAGLMVKASVSGCLWKGI